MYVSSNHTDWDAALRFMNFAYSSACQDTMGCPAFYPLFSREPSLLFDSLFALPPKPTLAEFTSDTVR